MKLQPLKRQETPLHKVAHEPQRKVANGRVIRKGGILTVAKHPPYNPAKPVVNVQNTQGTAWKPMGQKYLTQRY